jgi:hypothetical protein
MADIAVWLTSIPFIIGLVKTGHHYVYGTKTFRDNWLGWVFIVAGLILLGMFMGNMIQYQVLV